MFLFGPGDLGWCRDVPLMSFAFRVRVVQHVAFQTQPLDAGGALGVDGGDATDTADLCKEGKRKKLTPRETWKKENWKQTHCTLFSSFAAQGGAQSSKSAEQTWLTCGCGWAPGCSCRHGAGFGWRGGRRGAGAGKDRDLQLLLHRWDHRRVAVLRTRATHLLKP